MAERTDRAAAFHRHAKVDDLDIHYRVRDDLAPAGRTPVVLVHGQIVASDHVVPTLEHLAPDMPAYAPDLPGYGDSDTPDEGPDIEALAESLVHWMDAVGLERPHLFGSSFGCGVATAAAMHHPDRFERLVLQGPSMDPSGRGPLRTLLRANKDRQNEPVPYPVFFEDLRKAGLRRAIATWRLMYTDPIEERLPRIQAPTLVVHGSKDAILTLEWVQHVTRLLPNGRLLIIPGEAHLLVYNRPRRLADAMRVFFGITEGDIGTALAPGDLSALRLSR